MNLPFFIARRITRADAGLKPSVMERIASYSVTLSMVVMILALAVIVGFKREVADRMSAFAAHVSLTDIQAVHSLDAQPVERGEALEKVIRETEDFSKMYPYAVKGGIVRTEDAVVGVVLKGVDATYDWQRIDRWIVEGERPRVGDSIRTKDVLLSRNLSRKLMLGVGDKIEMLFVESGSKPRRDRFKVAGIYSSGMDEMDDRMMWTDLRNVQRLAGWSSGEVTGYEIFTSDLNEADDFAKRLNHRLLYDEELDAVNLVANNIQKIYPNIFDWLKAHNVNGVVVVVIMLIVAFFSMAAALLVLVLERTRMIGLLKALGMTNGDLRQIFLYRAGFIALKGLVWGNLIGLGLSMIQAWGGVISLKSEGYLLSQVPIAVEWGWWVLLNVGFVGAIVGLLVIPASIITSVKPEESIRYE